MKEIQYFTCHWELSFWFIQFLLGIICHHGKVWAPAGSFKRVKSKVTAVCSKIATGHLTKVADVGVSSKKIWDFLQQYPTYGENGNIYTDYLTNWGSIILLVHFITGRSPRTEIWRSRDMTPSWPWCTHLPVDPWPKDCHIYSSVCVHKRAERELSVIG